MLSVLIPAYNEEESIAATVATVRRVPDVSQVVVDDGSGDNTAITILVATGPVLDTGVDSSWRSPGP